MADDERPTRPSPDTVDDGVPATEEVPAGLLETGDDGVGEVPPAETPLASTAYGVTASEQLRGETLDDRLREEEPDEWRIGRGVRHTPRQLYEPGAEEGFFDDEPELIADEDALLEDTLSAEEAAMRITRRPGGINNDPDPGYIED
ncbi:MAG: hypothetical protein JWO37_1369 [Acidimicrobiales bacterium]|jgi:hypothetical protein|nr:hypothetical protein [Acidimicrobiales bacterium]